MTRLALSVNRLNMALTPHEKDYNWVSVTFTELDALRAAKVSFMEYPACILTNRNELRKLLFHSVNLCEPIDFFVIIRLFAGHFKYTPKG